MDPERSPFCYLLIFVRGLIGPQGTHLASFPFLGVFLYIKHCRLLGVVCVGSCIVSVTHN